MRVDAIRSYYNQSANNIQAKFQNNRKVEQKFEEANKQMPTVNGISFGKSSAKTIMLLFSSILSCFTSCGTKVENALDELPIMKVNKKFIIGSVADSIDVDGTMYYPSWFASGLNPQNKKIYYLDNPFFPVSRSYCVETSQAFLPTQKTASKDDVQRYIKANVDPKTLMDMDKQTRRSLEEEGSGVVFRQVIELNSRMSDDSLEAYIKEVAKPLRSDEVSLPEGIYVTKPRLNPKHSDPRPERYVKVYNKGKIIYSRTYNK